MEIAIFKNFCSFPAILQSAFTVTTGVGNIFDLTVMLALEGVFSSQAYLFFMFAGLMFLDMVRVKYLGTYTQFGLVKMIISVTNIID